MKRPEPRFRIHDDTVIHTRLPGQETWTALRIMKKTGWSVFIDTPDGELQLDRVALERTGQTKRLGRVYFLAHPGLPGLEERMAS